MATYTNLTPAEFSAKLQSDPHAVILDVRTAIEFREGHLPGAMNLSNVKEHLDALDHSKNYYVHCRVGGRSAVACQLMVNAGIPSVFNLNGSFGDVMISLQKAG